MLINICGHFVNCKEKNNKNNSTHCGGCEHPFSTFDKEFSMTLYKVHGNIVLYLLIDKVPVLMPGSRVSVLLGVSCVLISVCATAELDCPELGKCELSAI